MSLNNNKVILREKSNNLDDNKSSSLSQNEIRFRNLLSKVKNLSKNFHNNSDEKMENVDLIFNKLQEINIPKKS